MRSFALRLSLLALCLLVACAGTREYTFDEPPRRSAAPATAPTNGSDRSNQTGGILGFLIQGIIAFTVDPKYVHGTG